VLRAGRHRQLHGPAQGVDRGRHIMAGGYWSLPLPAR
jgi:hypothetical protein